MAVTPPQLLEELAVPLDGATDVVGYRLLDGTFGENMGAAISVSRLQHDCEPGSDASLDCSATAKLIAVDHSEGSVIEAVTWPLHGRHMAVTWPLHGRYMAVTSLRR